jgi:hypothetical protein
MGEPLSPWRIVAKECAYVGGVVSDVSKSGAGVACPRCKASNWTEITRIDPIRDEPGLIAYECCACGYVTSVIVPAAQQGSDDAH